jgi:hypothetical protein
MRHIWILRLFQSWFLSKIRLEIGPARAPSPGAFGGTMRKRERKFVGAVLMLSFVIIYALIATALAQARIVQQAAGPLQALYYAVLGMAWILPMMSLIKWMERPD